jgi:hypothetical protein
MKRPLVIVHDGEKTIVHFGLDNQEQVLISQVSQSVLIDRKIWLKIQNKMNDYFQVKSEFKGSFK